MQALVRPNILLLFLDDHGWGDTSVHLPNVTETPNMLRLASEGVSFHDFHVAASVCTPSRAANAAGATGAAGGTSADAHVQAGNRSTKRLRADDDSDSDAEGTEARRPRRGSSGSGSGDEDGSSASHAASSGDTSSEGSGSGDSDDARFSSIAVVNLIPEATPTPGRAKRPRTHASYDEVKRRKPRVGPRAHMERSGSRVVAGSSIAARLVGAATMERIVGGRYEWRDGGLRPLAGARKRCWEAQLAQGAAGGAQRRRRLQGGGGA